MLSNRLAQLFVSVAEEEVGADELSAVLTKSGLPRTATEKKTIKNLDGPGAAGLYAALQHALRLYYGRGSRGLLLRIGRAMWKRMVAQANIIEKAELEIARRLPVPARRRRVLDFLAQRLSEGGGSASVRLLGIDLMLTDSSSAAAMRPSSDRPVCFVTAGLIQEALLWATGQEVDVDEIACRAAGSPACEFKISFGGK
jgi:predicted hydrocarbon binding protein